MANVKFYQATVAKYDAATKDANAFYYVTDANDGAGALYLGSLLLSNGADLAAAIERLGDVEEAITTLNGGVGEAGSVAKQIKDAIDALGLDAKFEASGKVDDVKVNGTSVVADKIANISIGNHYEATELPAATGYKKDDVVVVKTTENGVDFRTAYYHNGTDWVAMDGNYDAENVYFNEDLVYTAGIGALAAPTAAEGSKTLTAKGKNVKQVLSSIMAQEKNPTATAPSLTIASTNIGAKEVGTNIAVAFTTTKSYGSYTYGPATGITFSDYKIKFNGETINADSGTFTPVQVGDNTSLKITGTFDHTQGAMPKTNLGNDYASVRIAAANDKAAVEKGTLTGFRRMFYGTMTTKPATMTSANIRSLAGGEAVANKDISVSVPVGAMRVVIAVPNMKKVTSVKDVNGLNAQIFSSFSSTTVNVEGANGYTAKAYNVYYLDYANANDKANTYTVTVANA